MSPRLRLRFLPSAITAALVTTACSAVTLEAGDPVALVRQDLSSVIHAADGTELGRLHGVEDRDFTTLDAVNPDIVAAVVAVEDRRYFSHRGVDLPAIARAATENAAAGAAVQGGSTITQQYIKNTVTGNATTLDRKMREAALAYQMEATHSKNDILERYLNTVYFGGGAYGVAAATERWFDSDASDVSLTQAALLAGMIASPSRFDPQRNPEAARDRRAHVLDALADVGRITQDEADAAKDAPLDVRTTTPADEVPSWAVAHVRSEFLSSDRFALLGDRDDREQLLYTGGLRFTTTLDTGAQQAAMDAIATTLTSDGDPEAALVAIDPRSGRTLALVGGARPPTAITDFSFATEGSRQPGSAFKPFVLATAYARGVQPGRVFPAGACATFPGTSWAPCNYGDAALPALTLADATALSANTVYARLGIEVGPQAVVETARSMGLEGHLPAVLAISLGAGEVTPFALADAYQPLAALGRRTPAYLIEEIRGPDSEVLYAADTSSYQALPSAVAWQTTQTLQEVVRRGTGVNATIDRPQAGKTGTSQNAHDAWFVGYTPDVVAAVWIGFPTPKQMEPPNTRERVEGGRWPATIWADFARRALADTPATDFAAPDVGLVTVAVDTSRQCLPNPHTPAELIREQSFLAGTEPREECAEPTGPALDGVPELVGLPVAAARRLLEDDGFAVDVRPLVSRQYPSGIVAEQRPGVGGTTLERDGNAVVIWVATPAAERLRVPKVTELPVLEAIKTLEDAGWFVDVSTSCSAPCSGVSGHVTSQAPAAGATAAAHSRVTVSVAP